MTEPEEVARELDRVADRLRVVAPRYAARGTPDAEAALEGVRAAVQGLADLAADAEGLPHRPMPRLAPHALPDQVLVLGHDLLASAGGTVPAGPELRAGHALLVELRRRL